MIVNIFTIHDSKAQAYLPPFFKHNEGMAIRDFSNLCQDPNHQFNRNPADFTLMAIGTFNDESAEIQWSIPYSLGNGLEHVPFQQQTPEI